MLRVIAGAFGGRVLRAPRGRKTRPTSARVREAVFAVLTHHRTHAPPLQGGRVLDLFAGSGALGIEALSRGAATALFVERGAAAVRTLRQNLQTLELTDRTMVMVRDIHQTLPTLRAEAPFDLVFLDPPYADQGSTRSLLLALEPAQRLTAQGVLVLEGPVDSSPPSLPGLEAPLSRRWGRTAVHFYRQETRAAHE